MDYEPTKPAIAQYPNFVGSRAKKLEGPVQDILHGAVGVAGEGGELLDAIKKCWIYNKPITVEVVDNLREECGDAMFYIQHICNQFGWTLEELVASNMIKLTKRYPKGYTDSAALARADKIVEHPSYGGGREKEHFLDDNPLRKE